MLDGQAPIIAPSFMVTVNEQLAVPQLFVAVQVTVVVPAANVLPLAGVHITVVDGVADTTVGAV